jgi:hypothetical protein
MKPISRYTSEVPVQTTIAQIHKMLTDHGAASILTDNGPDKKPDAISFRFQTEHGLLSFRLPARLAQIEKILAAKHPRTKREQIHEQAAMTGWRIIRDWLEAQLAITQTRMVSMTEVFLPYAQDNHGQTVYERLKDQKFSGLALEDRK